MKVVECLWEDAFIDTSDMKLKKARKLRPVVRSTIGYLVSDNKDCLILATDKFKKGNHISAPMVIPKGMILEYWEYEDVS